MYRTIKNEQLYIQEEHNMFINPSPLIPLPSVSFQCKRTTLSQQIDAKKRTRFGAGRGQGEGRFKFLTLKNLDVID